MRFMSKISETTTTALTSIMTMSSKRRPQNSKQTFKSTMGELLFQNSLQLFNNKKVINDEVVNNYLF